MKDCKKTDIQGQVLRPESLMMSYGYEPSWSEGAIKSPIFQTSTFVFKNAEEGKAFFELAYGLREQGPTEKLGLIYSRLNNPDLEILEDRLTLWDTADDAAVFTSGMAAIFTGIFEFLSPGDYLLHSEPLYGGTAHMFKHILPRYGIQTRSFVAGSSRDEIEARLDGEDFRGRLAFIFAETPANPTNRLVDIAHCAEIAKRYSTPERRVVVGIDNTFIGPVWQHPLEHGADLVFYSATKYLGGHSDLIAGVCLGKKEFMGRVKAMRTFLGTMAGPWTGWLLLRSLETLKLRMTCQNKNARYVADFLADHNKVEKVYYLGHMTEGDPQFGLYRKQCAGPGGMIAFDVVGGEIEAFRFLNALQLIKLAVSLGGTESLAEHPFTMTHADVEPDLKRKAGVSEQLVRLSIGVEHPEDLVADLKQALEAV